MSVLWKSIGSNFYRGFHITWPNFFMDSKLPIFLTGLELATSTSKIDPLATQGSRAASRETHLLDKQCFLESAYSNS